MNTDLEAVVLDILDSCRELSLATLMRDGNTQSDVVCFVHQGLDIYFATARDSRKIANIEHAAQVSFCIYKPYTGWPDIKAISSHAFAEILPDESPERSLAIRLLDTRFPNAWTRIPEHGSSRTTIVKLESWALKVLDYSRGFGHTDMVPVASKRRFD
ncbi:hypothetical protein LV28_25185 [Pandoraea pnomenusa]|jgi:nitroimidazol reductase NimA-like FMN-containing flavoprotein (pyridoxamine 5'-phosphate oxidase superfamily)|uniref:PPOX class probable F420-dependent enzyme n=1 Tax=Pandoraea pnomenusa TaxID=93220 RepID=A0A378YBP1_9BURK|nr:MULTISPECIES: pyridoxamine 5'-phosphate oxidase family protein [Pandoraea]AHB77969.1 hypothetical protein X636_22955 [Pandoraea pnomenusa]AHN73737.1 hypothetical protein DA70_04150 [Pandoraea pnomenusa]ALR35926.1 hypothetical protein LV28_25185 [Pandoraea pnomenusa]ANC46645.1 hypothetical protein A6P55_23205 [Pandoraea pnomenusa]MBN9094966.1 pyridoxamine 5'-phosphate oxidase family protein [Pandoraea pnomenusa]